MYKLMQQLDPGDHAALFYRNRAEQFAVMTAYVRVGLERNERCFYVAGDNSVRMILDAMKEAGIDVEKHTASGALTVTTVQESFLKYGAFNPQKMVDDLHAEVTNSLEQGYSGFRGTGEMLWAVHLPSALGQLHEYEARLDEQFPAKFVAMCQYNEACFSPELVSQILRTHPKVVARGRLLDNHYYVPNGKSLTTESPLVTVERVLAAT